MSARAVPSNLLLFLFTHAYIDVRLLATRNAVEVPSGNREMVKMLQ